VQKFAGLTLDDIHGVMRGLGFTVLAKPKAKALEAVVSHVLAARTATDHAQV